MGTRERDQQAEQERLRQEQQQQQEQERSGTPRQQLVDGEIEMVTNPVIINR